MGAGSPLTIGASFQASNADLTKHIKKSEDFDKDIDPVTGAAKSKLKDAVDDLSSASADQKDAILKYGTALKNLSAEKLKTQVGADEIKKAEVAAEKERVVGAIEFVGKLCSAGEKALKGGGKEEGGVSEAVTTVAAYFVGQSYENDLKEIETSINNANTCIQSYYQDIAADGVVSEGLAIIKAQIAMRQKKRAIATADQEYRVAVASLAKSAKANAAANGASKSEQDQLNARLRALPAVELVVTRLRAIIERLVTPVYSEPSGLGAQFCTNVGLMSGNLSKMKGAELKYSALLVTWMHRLGRSIPSRSRCTSDSAQCDSFLDASRARPCAPAKARAMHPSPSNLGRWRQTWPSNSRAPRPTTNLKDAFAGESQANRRYLYFAKVADVEGHPDIAGLFRDTAEGETGHAHGHLDYLKRGRRSGDGRADRQHREEPQGVDRRRDLRVHDDVPGLRQDRARRGLRRDRRVVRDAGAGREVARRPLPEGPRLARILVVRADVGENVHRETKGATPSLFVSIRRLLMKKLVVSDYPPRLYAPIRDDLRKRVIEVKRARRVTVGEMTVVFENRATMLFQVQEMLRAERIVDPAKVQEEIDVYNKVLPDDGELAATLFVEITDEARSADAAPAGRPGRARVARHRRRAVRGEFDAGSSQRIAGGGAVHAVPVVAGGAEGAGDAGAAVALAVDHPAYRHSRRPHRRGARLARRRPRLTRRPDLRRGASGALRSAVARGAAWRRGRRAPVSGRAARRPTAGR